jgi:hypothetical protein
MQFQFVSIVSTCAFSKDAFPSAGFLTGEPFIQPAKTSPVFLRKSSSAIRLSFALRSLAAQRS